MKRTGVLLTHGAGSNADAPLLVRLEADLVKAGCTVVRYNLPFRVKRPKGPPGAGDAARDRAGLAEALAALRAQGCARVVAAGVSYGGRQCSMLVAEQPGVADALLTLAYPLHAPGKPEARRDAHFPAIGVPWLAVMGDRDAFATVEEMTESQASAGGVHTLHVVPGQGHGLKPTAALSAVVQSWLAGLR